MVRIGAAGQIYKQMQSFTYLGGTVTETPDTSVEIVRRTRACWMRIRRYTLTGALRLTESCALCQDPDGKVRSNRSPSVWMQYVDPLQEHYAKLRTVHHRVLLRIIGAQRKRPDHRMTSYNRALEMTRYEGIETTLRTRRLLWAGTLLSSE